MLLQKQAVRKKSSELIQTKKNERKDRWKTKKRNKEKEKEVIRTYDVSVRTGSDRNTKRHTATLCSERWEFVRCSI